MWRVLSILLILKKLLTNININFNIGTLKDYNILQMLTHLIVSLTVCDNI